MGAPPLQSRVQGEESTHTAASNGGTVAEEPGGSLCAGRRGALSSRCAESISRERERPRAKSPSAAEAELGGHRTGSRGESPAEQSTSHRRRRRRAGRDGLQVVTSCKG